MYGNFLYNYMIVTSAYYTLLFTYNCVFICFQILRQLPTFNYLFNPVHGERLSIRKVISLLKPNFSEEGSNSLKFEKEVYALFIKYLREVAGTVCHSN